MVKWVRTPFCLALMLMFFRAAGAAEIEVKIHGGIGKTTVRSISGTHVNLAGTPILGSAVNLTDNKARDTLFGIDASYYFSDRWAMNIDLSYMKQKLKDTAATVHAAPDTIPVSPFPAFSYTGYMLGIGPKYRWKDLSPGISPYAVISLVGFFGKQDNTKYSINPTLYGHGGSKTNVRGIGVSPKIGITFAVNEKLNLGIEYRYTYLAVHAGKMRSLQWGYKANISSHDILVDVGYSFGN